MAPRTARRGIRRPLFPRLKNLQWLRTLQVIKGGCAAFLKRQEKRESISRELKCIQRRAMAPRTARRGTRRALVPRLKNLQWLRTLHFRKTVPVFLKKYFDKVRLYYYNKITNSQKIRKGNGHYFSRVALVQQRINALKLGNDCPIILTKSFQALILTL